MKGIRFTAKIVILTIKVNVRLLLGLDARRIDRQWRCDVVLYTLTRKISDETVPFRFNGYTALADKLPYTLITDRTALYQLSIL